MCGGNHTFVAMLANCLNDGIGKVHPLMYQCLPMAKSPQYYTPINIHLPTNKRTHRHTHVCLCDWPLILLTFKRRCTWSNATNFDSSFDSNLYLSNTVVMVAFHTWKSYLRPSFADCLPTDSPPPKTRKRVSLQHIIMSKFCMSHDSLRW